MSACSLGITERADSYKSPFRFCLQPLPARGIFPLSSQLGAVPVLLAARENGRSLRFYQQTQRRPGRPLSRLV